MTHWTERHRVVLAVFVIVRRPDGKILMLRRANTGYMDGRLGLPSGHVDGEEPAERALIREAQEEIGITIAPKNLHHVHTLHRRAEVGTHEYIDLYFETTHWTGIPRNMEPHKCSELLWVDLGHVPNDVIPAVGRTLKVIEQGRTYSSADF